MPPDATATRVHARHFAFGASTYIVTALLAFLTTVFTLGICYPFALVLRERWRAGTDGGSYWDLCASSKIRTRCSCGISP